MRASTLNKLIFVDEPQPNDAANLRDYLANRDVPCRVCNYNLRGLSTTTCPECSAPVLLGIITDEPLRRWRKLFCGAIAALAIGEAVEVLRWGRQLDGLKGLGMFDLLIITRTVFGFLLGVAAVAIFAGLMRHPSDADTPRFLRHALMLLIVAPMVHLALAAFWYVALL
jgi:hypothetical protein